MREGFHSITTSMRVIIASMVTETIGIIVMLVQLNQPISRL